jgi:hypothetical protein
VVAGIESTDLLDLYQSGHCSKRIRLVGDEAASASTLNMHGDHEEVHIARKQRARSLRATNEVVGCCLGHQRDPYGVQSCEPLA